MCSIRSICSALCLDLSLSCVDAMPSHFSAPLRQLTRRVTASLGLHSVSSRVLGKMADQEEDFSSLPLPDRFVHKVRRRVQHTSLLDGPA